ncbi:MAG: hypothetical protein BGN88_06810 [Clostridiales bacterium 43-6]|nr:MAG: hypothetical protein BGN88_06810 [Clostridiales bacterium 43-6]
MKKNRSVLGIFSGIVYLLLSVSLSFGLILSIVYTFYDSTDFTYWTINKENFAVYFSMIVIILFAVSSILFSLFFLYQTIFHRFQTMKQKLRTMSWIVINYFLFSMTPTLFFCNPYNENPFWRYIDAHLFPTLVILLPLLFILPTVLAVVFLLKSMPKADPETDSGMKQRKVKPSVVLAALFHTVISIVFSLMSLAFLLSFLSDDENTLYIYIIFVFIFICLFGVISFLLPIVRFVRFVSKSPKKTNPLAKLFITLMVQYFLFSLIPSILFLQIFIQSIDYINYSNLYIQISGLTPLIMIAATVFALLPMKKAALMEATPKSLSH